MLALRNRLARLAIPAILAGAAVSPAEAFTFTDNFTPAPSAAWSNSAGSWADLAPGDYAATAPNNNPEALSKLPFVFSDANDQVTVTVNDLGDGGVLFETPSESNYVLLVVGGLGYGVGNRGGGAGNSIYWATAINPTATINEHTGVFTPGDTYTLTVTDVAGTLNAYVDPDGTFDGSSSLLTSLVAPALSTLEVGLYDNQPNTTTGSGFGPPQSFSGFSVSGALAAPEPMTWTLLLVGFCGLGAELRSRRRLLI